MEPDESLTKDDFTLVVRGQKGRPKKRKGKAQEAATLGQLYEERREALSEEGWLNRVDDMLNQVPANSRPRKILCLGLGTLEGLTGRKGRTQLGLLVHLQNKFGISSTDVELFDPVFTDEEKAFLSSFGFTVRAEQTSHR
ncbi:hypothetical protein BT69DRAFT_1344136 [Atractiella rhizophila]|nr:hypothetical protein BT69DRAFT_1344136 [Atractiella rhizophila]